MDTRLIACEACGSTNRVPIGGHGHGTRPVCGRCEAPLPWSVPVATNAEDRRPPAAALKLSAEFIAGGTESGLEKIRARLLDLTNRNRLLNFRHGTASSLRAVDTDLNAVYQHLIAGDRIAFAPVPEPGPDSDPGEEANENAPVWAKPAAAEYAKRLGWKCSFDLEPGTQDGISVLPVLHYVDGLAILTRKIGSAAKTAIEESGTTCGREVIFARRWARWTRRRSGNISRTRSGTRMKKDSRSPRSASLKPALSRAPFRRLQPQADFQSYKEPTGFSR
jgi:hypothetical protein